MTGDTPNLFDAPDSGRAPALTPTRSDSARAEALHAGFVPSIEYTPIGETRPWRVEKWPELCARFQIGGVVDFDAVATIRSIHEALRSHPFWLVVRRLFGVTPVIATSPDDLRPWNAPELCAVLGITDEVLQAQIEGARAAWESFVRRSESVAEPVAPAPPLAPEGELPFDEERVLEEFGFSNRMFEVQWETWEGKDKKTERRPQEENRREKSWFAREVEACRKMLMEKRGGADDMARSLLLNKLSLRRLEPQMARLQSGTAEWRALDKDKAELERRVIEQHEKLDGLFPEFNAAGKVTFRQCLGDIVKGQQQYYAYDDNRLVNKICTLNEVEWQMRQCQQRPEPALRMGQQLYILEAMAGLFDPNWRSQLKLPMLKKLDAVGKAAIETVRQKEGETLINLEKESDEFPDFPEPVEVKEAQA